MLKDLNRINKKILHGQFKWFFFFLIKTIPPFLFIILCECYQQTWNLCSLFTSQTWRLLAHNVSNSRILPCFWCVFLASRLSQCHRTVIILFNYSLHILPYCSSLLIYTCPYLPQKKAAWRTEKESSWSSSRNKEGHSHVYRDIMHSLAAFLLAVSYKNCQVKLDIYNFLYIDF